MSNAKINHPKPKILFRVLFALITLAVMTVIFMLSAENAQQSADTSAGVIEKVAETFAPSYKKMQVYEKQQFVSSLQDAVRKAAHFSVFAALGVSVACFASTFKAKPLLKLILCELFCCIYALSDEYHQTFSEGRSFQLSDIATDSLGSLCGILLVFFTVYIFTKIKEKSSSKRF